MRNGGRNNGRQPGLFDNGGGGGDQGDHGLAHGLIREGIQNEFQRNVGHGLDPRQAAQQVADQIRNMPGHQRGGVNPFEHQLDQAIQGLPARPGLRPRVEAQQHFQQMAEGFEQHNPIGAVRFGDVGHGEGHRLRGLRQQEAMLERPIPGPFNRQQVERNMRGLMDAEALHNGMQAQHEANQQGDAHDAHFPGFVELPDGRPDFAVMRQEQAQRGAGFMQMAFPRVVLAHGNVQNVFQQHQEAGGDQDVDPDYMG